MNRFLEDMQKVFGTLNKPKDGRTFRACECGRRQKHPHIFNGEKVWSCSGRSPECQWKKS